LKYSVRVIICDVKLLCVSRKNYVTDVGAPLWL